MASLSLIVRRLFLLQQLDRNTLHFNYHQSISNLINLKHLFAAVTATVTISFTNFDAPFGVGWSPSRISRSFLLSFLVLVCVANKPRVTLLLSSSMQWPKQILLVFQKYNFFQYQRVWWSGSYTKLMI